MPHLFECLSQQMLSSNTRDIIEMSHQMDLTRWSVLKSNWLYPLLLNVEKPCRVRKNKTRSWLWLRSSGPYYKLRLKLQKKKKAWKTSRPFRCDWNQISYDYTMKAMNTFKGIDLVDRVPENRWMEVHNIVQELIIKTISKKKKCKKAKWLSGDLQTV